MVAVRQHGFFLKEDFAHVPEEPASHVLTHIICFILGVLSSFAPHGAMGWSGNEAFPCHIHFFFLGIFCVTGKVWQTQKDHVSVRVVGSATLLVSYQ